MSWDVVRETFKDPNIQSKLEAEAKYWNSVPEGFVGPISPPDLKSYLDKALDNLIDYNTSTVRMLDFGCGVSRIYNALDPKCMYYGVDISETYLKMARDRYPGAHLILLKTQELPFLSNYFDLVIAYSVLTHIPPDNQCELIMSELYRVLKPNGILLVSTFINTQNPSPNWVVYTEDFWSATVSRIGFKIHKLTMVREDGRCEQSLYTLVK